MNALSDYEIEQCFIRGLLWGRASSLPPVGVDDFADPHFRQIFQAAARLCAAGDPLSPDTVANMLGGDGPDLATLWDLHGAAGTDADLPYWARELRDRAGRRRALAHYRAAAGAMEEGRPERAAQHAADALAAVTATAEPSIDADLAVLERRAAGQDRPIPLPWANLAAALGGGLWPGVHVVVGSPGAGKTQLALQAALHAAAQGTRVGYVALELGSVDLTARCLGLMSGTMWSRLFLGGAPGLLAGVVQDYAAQLKALPIRRVFGPPGGWHYDKLYPLARERAGADHQPALIIVDYLQLLGGDERSETRERIGHAAYAARAVARDLGAAVVLVSSTSRGNYDQKKARKDESPLWELPAETLIGTAKEAGDIEFAADSVINLVRDKDCVHVAISKLRCGPAGAWLELQFDGTRFKEPPARVFA